MTKKILTTLLVFMVGYVCVWPAVSTWYREIQLRRGSYAYAKKCSGEQGGLTYDEVHIRVLPGDRIVVNGQLVVAAIFSPEDSTIYIAEAHRYHPQILAHEYLHAIRGIGHPQIFKDCLLDTEQIYNLP